MTDPTTPATPAPAKRPYVPPALVVHGDVQALTHQKGGFVIDGDGGSFIP